MFRTVLVASAIMLGAIGANAEAGTSFSAAGSTCIPESPSGYTISAGTISANGGVTIKCDVPVGKAELDTQAVNAIEITTKGDGQATATAALYGVSKSTGVETQIGYAVSAPSSATVATNYVHIYQYSFYYFIPDWENNFYYIRVTLHSDIVVGTTKTLYGVSLRDI